MALAECFSGTFNYQFGNCRCKYAMDAIIYNFNYLIVLVTVLFNFNDYPFSWLSVYYAYTYLWPPLKGLSWHSGKCPIREP